MWNAKTPQPPKSVYSTKIVNTLDKSAPHPIGVCECLTHWGLVNALALASVSFSHWQSTCLMDKCIQLEFRSLLLSLNMLNFFKVFKRYLYILILISKWELVCKFGVIFHTFIISCPGATIHGYPTLPIPCLLMLWWLQEPGHQQAWYWPPKPEYSVSSSRRVNWWATLVTQNWDGPPNHQSRLVHWATQDFFCSTASTPYTHISESTLVHITACCPTAPSHYLNQFRLNISEVQWQVSTTPEKHFFELSRGQAWSYGQTVRHRHRQYPFSLRVRVKNLDLVWDSCHKLSGSIQLSCV